MISHRPLFLVAVLMAALSLSACATEPTAPAEKADFKALNDPFEPTNRFIFDLNDFLDRLLIAPLAGFYDVTVPPPVRERIASMLNNMSEPVIFANNLMQGEMNSAGITLSRLTVNSTLGIGGMFEVANDFDLPQQHGDFGQTLHVWGTGEGPYIVLPLFGSSNVRDAVGLGVDTLLSPWKYAVADAGGDARTIYDYADLSASALTRREQVLDVYDSLREGSLDFYAQMRSIYRQHRAKELGETTATDTPQFEDYESDGKAPIIK